MVHRIINRIEVIAMPSRYDNRTIGTNKSKLYRKQLDNRGVKFIEQYTTANVTYPTARERSFLNPATVVWSVGDRLYKLAHEYYGDSTYWWLIAWYNQKPTESHFVVGDVVEIPLPFNRALSAYNRRVD